MHAGGGLGKRDLARCRARGERVRDSARSLGDERPKVRQADASLARPEPGKAGALDELELAEPATPDTLEIVDGHARAWTDRARGRGRWERERLGRRPDHGDREVAGHA